MAEEEKGQQPPIISSGTDENEQDPMAIFATMKKIKKKPKSTQTEEPSSTSQSTETTTNEPTTQSTASVEEGEGEEAWLKSDRDYTYSELLTRISKALRANNPELGGEKKKINMVLPIVNREGTKKCSFTNVMEVCKKLSRSSDHVIQFLLAELGTTGSIDQSQALIIRGRFQQKP